MRYSMQHEAPQEKNLMTLRKKRLVMKFLMQKKIPIPMR